MHVRHEASQELIDAVDPGGEDGRKSEFIDEDEKDVRLRPGYGALARTAARIGLPSFC